MRSRAIVAIASLLFLNSFANAIELLPLVTDINGNEPVEPATAVIEQSTLFADEPAFFVDDTALDGGNDIAVFTMDGVPTFNGGGFTLAVSNGENGIDATEAGMNMDVPNPFPVNSAIAGLNASGRLETGNAIRLSVWMRQDPDSPVMAVPQIEPVLKIELWKEASSSTADFAGAEFPNFGDRIWDTDQNAGFAAWNGEQSEASWIDLNNSGSTTDGKDVSQSIVTDEWRLVETSIVIDDDPLADGLGWSIGAESFYVGDVEEIRGVLFFGDYENRDLNGAGSFWVDNLSMEIFATEADMMNTANANPLPTDEGGGLACDFNADGQCDAADIDALYGSLGTAGGEFDVDGSGTVDSGDIGAWLASASDPANAYLGGTKTFVIGDANLDGGVDSTDLGLLLNNFGSDGSPSFGAGNLNGDTSVDSTDLGLLLNNFGASSASASAVPEPSAVSLLLLAVCGLATGLRRRR